MADFHQNGTVATLHDLRIADPVWLQRELEVIASSPRQHSG